MPPFFLRSLFYYLLCLMARFGSVITTAIKVVVIFLNYSTLLYILYNIIDGGRVTHVTSAPH
jgi:hypothetical protein